jgi:hypothetical protein
MHNKNWWMGIALIGLLAGGCTAEQTPVGAVKPKGKPFFDLKAYFDKEAQRLSESPMTIYKQTRVNEKTAESQTDSIDWSQELKVFRESDINRASWINKYAGDTTRTASGQLQRIQYEALEKKLRVQRIEIEFAGDESVAAIVLQKQNRSLIADSDQELTYRPQEGYSLVSQQKVLFSGKTEVEVRAEFQ